MFVPNDVALLRGLSAFRLRIKLLNWRVAK
jgi:hypothetical protein